ncbi:trimeric intracellular cation channel family protein [Novosphingobium sp.]|uniref:trimeric intracellular cation channel family protein n=1 Tax=Novosphingobium sp. TaxID=1874826 RepID=UPI0025EC0C8C|nr:trimeric intracellular cation channel family protein [Novosphingobium sp.]
MNPALPSLPPVLDLAGTAIFALSGALLAARLRQTFVTMTFFALITGVGGGTVRDLLIGAPAFWVRDPYVAAVCLGVAGIAWFTPRGWWEGQLLEWADAAGLAVYAVLGTAKALAFGVAPIPAMMMGVITGCVGGVIRDVLANRPSIIMRPEIYVTAAALTSALVVAGSLAGLPRAPVWMLAALAGFILRGLAISRGLALPSYKRDTA